VTLKGAEISKLKYTKGIKVQYTPYKQTKATITPVVTGASPVFNHSTVFYYDKVDQAH
jgi:hypothetical protein